MTGTTKRTLAKLHRNNPEMEDVVRENDTVVIYLNTRSMKRVKMQSGKDFQCKHGIFKHDQIISNPYGKKIYSVDKKSGRRTWAVVLKNSPQLFLKVLNFRTQILYLKDISYLLLLLDIKMNSFVVECGTGSGAFSVFIARAIAPKGHLFTFEIDEERFANAKSVFTEMGVDRNTSVMRRDICTEGFPTLPELNALFLEKNPVSPETNEWVTYTPSGLSGVSTGETENVVNDADESSEKAKQIEIDAVFLDIPSPWEAIAHAFATLKEGGRLCCFSPCIEQVQKTTAEIAKHSFVDVKTLNVVDVVYSTGKFTENHESLTRIYEDEHTHSGFFTFADKAVSVEE